MVSIDSDESHGERGGAVGSQGRRAAVAVATAPPRRAENACALRDLVKWPARRRYWQNAGNRDDLRQG